VVHRYALLTVTRRAAGGSGRPAGARRIVRRDCELVTAFRRRGDGAQSIASEVGIVIGSHSGDDRDLRQGAVSVFVSGHRGPKRIWTLRLAH